MEKKVFINIEDSHSGHDDSYSSQTSTQGVLRLLENGYELSYEEPAAEMEGCVTTLLIEDGGLVTMTRNGAYTTQMVMERGRRHVCHYATPFGDMLLGIFAKKVESSVTEDGGELLLIGHEFNPRTRRSICTADFAQSILPRSFVSIFA